MNLKKKNLKQLSEKQYLNKQQAGVVVGGVNPPVQAMCTTTLDTEMNH